MMMSSIWKNALFLKCPACGKGKLFQSKHSYQFSGILKMNNTCQCCGEDFQVEPGFYQGAMYMSYIITCAMCIVLLPFYAALNFSREEFLDNALYYIGACAILLLFTAPYVTQFSRAVWLALHIKYFKKDNP